MVPLLHRSARRLTCLLALAATVACGPKALPPDQQAAFAAAMNQGRAWLENKDSGQAKTAFATAAAIDPRSAAALRNLARAELLAREQTAALATLERAAKLERGAPATAYLEGVARAREGQHEEAIRAFELAAKSDRNTAALRFQLAAALQAAGRIEEAERQLEETLRLDPLHVTAYYRLARAASARGDRDAFARWNGEFLRLRKELGTESRSAEELEASIYTLAEEPAGLTLPPAASPAPIRFADATAALFGKVPVLFQVALLEADAAGRYTLVGLTDSGQLGLLRPAGAAYTWQPTTGVTAVPAGSRLVPLNFRDPVPAGTRYDASLHAAMDLAVLAPEGLRLLVRTGPDAFEDVTAASGLGTVPARALQPVDTDHDGDLDLLVATAAGLQLWQNDGDGTFTDATAAAGLAGAGSAEALTAADLDGDVAVDLLAAGPAGTTLWKGARLGRFARHGESWPGGTAALADFWGGGARPGVLVAGGTGLAARFLGAAGNRELPLAVGPPTALAALDADNDGQLDLAVGGTSLALLRDAGGLAWADVSAAAGLAGPKSVRTLLAADLDGDGDTDLAGIADGGLFALANQGTGEAKQLKVRLTGTKTNPQALATEVAAIAPGFAARRVVQGPAVELGLGARAKLDAVRTVWGNGVVDNEIEASVTVQGLTLVEKNVATGSCPFLYAWDGQRFRFVTDLLGNAPIGLPLSREQMLPADPDEYVEIGPAPGFPPVDGEYRLVTTSEFREVFYLDEARLVAADHEAGVEVHPTDKLMPAPFPPSELWALGQRRPLVAATDAAGRDERARLAELDDVMATAGVPLPPPLRGQTHTVAFTLDFGPLPVARPLVLALSGWLQYGDASANIALDQQRQGWPVVPPTLEAETANGRFVPVPVVVGMPAGKSKTILVDLAGQLPPRTRRLRLSTTFEIRWDRIALFERLAPSALTLHEVRPTRSELAFRGFSPLERAHADGPTRPDFNRVSPQPPWRTALAGWSTRFGDVLELVAARDGQLAILNSGDAATLAFPASALPPPAAGRQRTFFFYSVGWDKDSDHNITTGDTVEPLPGQEAVIDPTWTERFNTRWVPLHAFAGGR